MMPRKTKPYVLFIVLIAPVLILRMITAAYPIIKTINLSLTDSRLLDGTSAFIGLDNYRQLFQDTEFRFAFSFTLIFILLSTFFQLALGLLIALSTMGVTGLGQVGSALMTLLDQPHTLAAVFFEGRGTALTGGVMQAVSWGMAPFFALPAVGVILALFAQQAWVFASAPY